MIDISVIVPCTDRVIGLKQCLESVLNQSYSGTLEILLIENNSQDRKIISNLVGSINDVRIRHVYMDKCDNANWARNFGVEISLGKYIAFLDSDDWWALNHLEECLALAADREVAIYSGYIMNDGKRERYKISKEIGMGSAYTFLFGSNSGVAQTSSFFIHSNIFKKCKWDQDLKRSQDYDFFIHIQNNIGWTFKPTLTVHVFWELGIVRAVSFNSFVVFYSKHNQYMTDVESNNYVVEVMKSLALSNDNGYIYFKNKLKSHKVGMSMKDKVMTSNIVICRSLLLFKIFVSYISSFIILR